MKRAYTWYLLPRNDNGTKKLKNGKIGKGYEKKRKKNINN